MKLFACYFKHQTLKTRQEGLAGSAHFDFLYNITLINTFANSQLKSEKRRCLFWYQKKLLLLHSWLLQSINSATTNDSSNVSLFSLEE